MAALFTAASSQRLVNSDAKIIQQPFSFGCWFYPFSTSAMTIFAMSDTATANNYFELRMTTSLVWAAAGTTENAATINSAITANAWHYVVARAVSGSLRSIYILKPSTGLGAFAQNTTATTPAGIDNMSLGSRESSSPTNFFDGLIGEFWISNSNFPDGLGTFNETLHKLARGGPFSLPVLNSGSFYDYLSLRKSCSADNIEDVKYGRFGVPAWVNTNGVSIGRHPPLPYWHARPGQRKLIIPV